MSEENKAVYRKLVDGMNSGNAEILDEVYSPSLVYYTTGPSVNLDREGVKQYLTAVVAAFPDCKMTIDDLLADGDKVIYRMTYRGTHKGDLFGVSATNKEVTARTIGIARILDGKIVEEWENMDEMGMMQQLGVVTMPGQ